MEFVAVVPLLFLVGLSVLQLALFAHAKAMVSTAAVEAARAAAVSIEPRRAAEETAAEILGTALVGVPVDQVSVSRQSVVGLPFVVVELRARPALDLLPGRPGVTGRGRALVEEAP